MRPPVDHDADRILEAFFEPGPRHISHALSAAIRSEVHHTGQARGLPRWNEGMARFALPVAGLGALAAVIVMFALLSSSPNDIVGPGASGTLHASPSSRSSAMPSPEQLAPFGYRGGGTIAFTRNAPSLGGDGTWLIAPDGSGESQVVVHDQNGATWSDYPACCLLFSPNGTDVAVGYLRNDGLPGYTDLMWTYILTLDGGAGGWLPNCGACAMMEGLNYLPRAWSPDGSLIALEAWSDDDPTRTGMNIALVNDFGWAEQVGGNHNDVPIAFSPDGTRLLFVRVTDHVADGERGTLMELTIPDLSDACCSYEKMRQIRGATREVGAPGMLTTINDYFGAPASWSPDGRKITFAATDPSSTTGAMRIWVVDGGGGQPVAITSGSAIYTGAAWSPDGSWIAFDRLAAGSGFHDLFIAKPDGSGETNLTESFAPGVCCGRWSPDSTALLVAGTRGDNEASYLFIVPIDGSPVAQVTTLPGTYTDFSWGPESR